LLACKNCDLLGQSVCVDGVELRVNRSLGVGLEAMSVLASSENGVRNVAIKLGRLEVDPGAARKIGGYIDNDERMIQLLAARARHAAPAAGGFFVQAAFCSRLNSSGAQGANRSAADAKCVDEPCMPRRLLGLHALALEHVRGNSLASWWAQEGHQTGGAPLTCLCCQTYHAIVAMLLLGVYDDDRHENNIIVTDATPSIKLIDFAVANDLWAASQDSAGNGPQQMRVITETLKIAFSSHGWLRLPGLPTGVKRIADEIWAKVQFGNVTLAALQRWQPSGCSKSAASSREASATKNCLGVAAHGLKRSQS
jgi:hypothetical protein